MPWPCASPPSSSWTSSSARSPPSGAWTPVATPAWWPTTWRRPLHTVSAGRPRPASPDPPAGQDLTSSGGRPQRRGLHGAVAVSRLLLGLDAFGVADGEPGQHAAGRGQAGGQPERRPKAVG